MIYKKTQLVYILGAIAAVLLLVVIYLVATRKKGDYTKDDVEAIHMSLRQQMEQELANSQHHHHQSHDDADEDETDVNGHLPAHHGSGGVVVLFHNTGCPHCSSMMDDWAQFKSNPAVIKSGVGIKEIEGAETRQHGIKGVPMIKYYPPGQFPNPTSAIVYKGDRSAGSFIKFALSKGAQF